MKDFQDLMGQKFESNHMEKFEQIQKQLKQNKPAEDDKDYEDQLQDQMAESLFQEANQMGIFQEQGVDYGAALKKIDEEIKKNKDKPLPSKAEKTDEDDNEDLYNQECNLVEDDNQEQMSAYETEYHEVISCMSKICRHLVWNNNNPNRKIKVEEAEVVELTPRIWQLSVEYEKQTPEDKKKCFLQTLLKGSFSLLGIKIPKCALKVSACNIQIFFKIFDQVIKKHEKNVDI